MKWLLSSALALGFMAPLSAQLTWERTVVELSPRPGQPSVVAEFPFVNQSAAAVEVLEIHSSCGCTTPELAQKRYAPGESGALKATFEIEHRQGLQEKVIQVQTDAGAVELKLVVHVPVRLEISPRMLVFAGSEREPKAARLQFLADAPIQDIAIASASGPFDAELVALEAGRVFELRVRPQNATPANAGGAVVLRSKGASGTETFDTIFLRQRP